MSFLADRDEVVSLRAEARQAGYLVLDDSYYPGWHATVDGRPAKILAANGNFRAVALPPGVHTVDFRYAPVSFRVGAILSVLTAAGLVLALALLLIRRRRAALRYPGGR